MTSSIPDAFWEIRAGVNPSQLVRYHSYVPFAGLSSQRSETMLLHRKTRSLWNLLQLKKKPNLHIYEVLDQLNSAALSLNFLMDRCCYDKARALEAALDFIRGIAGGETIFAVSEAHSGAEMRFQVVCPYVTVTKNQMIEIIRISKILDLGMENPPLVENGASHARSALMVGHDLTDSIRLVPTTGYVGVFSDHLIQIIRPGSVALLDEDLLKFKHGVLPSRPPTVHQESGDQQIALLTEQIESLQKLRASLLRAA